MIKNTYRSRKQEEKKERRIPRIFEQTFEPDTENKVVNETKVYGRTVACADVHVAACHEWSLLRNFRGHGTFNEMRARGERIRRERERESEEEEGRRRDRCGLAESMHPPRTLFHILATSATTSTKPLFVGAPLTSNGEDGGGGFIDRA